tara:strand:- start:2228 stop:2455 length:228 start_codon:yes stop_codon:yes gene_type:complete
LIQTIERPSGRAYLMVLYTELQLNRVYRIYAKHQGAHGVPFITLDNFRRMFEEQQEMLIEGHIELLRGLDDDPNN